MKSATEWASVCSGGIARESEWNVARVLRIRKQVWIEPVCCHHPPRAIAIRRTTDYVYCVIPRQLASRYIYIHNASPLISDRSHFSIAWPAFRTDTCLVPREKTISTIVWHFQRGQTGSSWHDSSVCLGRVAYFSTRDFCNLFFICFIWHFSQREMRSLRRESFRRDWIFKLCYCVIYFCLGWIFKFYC